MNIERVNMVRQLIEVGDIARPDKLGMDGMSAGADFLDTAAVCLMEAIEYGRIVPDRVFCADGESRDDVLQEIASESVPVYTYGKWAAFTDLCAFEYGWSDGESGTSMDDMANSRLTCIAYTAMHEWLAKYFDAEG